MATKKEEKKAEKPDHLGLTDEESKPSADAASEAAPPAPAAPVAGVGKALGVVQEPAAAAVAEPHLKVRSVPTTFRAGGQVFVANKVVTVLLKDLTPRQLEAIEHAAKHKMLKVTKST